MSRLVAAELLKLRTTRATWGYLVALVALLAISVAGTIGAAPDEVVDETLVHDTLTTVGFASLFALLLGILGFTTEYRHGTATQTFLVEPVRERVLVSKLIAFAFLGLVLGLVSVALTLAIAVPWLESRGLELGLGEREHLLLLTGGVGVSVLWGALGVSFGALVRNQVAAMVGVLVWLLVVENLAGVIPRVEDAAPYLPGRASSGMIGDDFMDDNLSRTAGTLVTLAYVAGFALVAGAVLRRRDVA